MTTQHAEALIDKLRELAPEQLAEVEDFVDFLRERREQHQLRWAALRASEEAFARVWDNPDDAVYDQL